MDNNSLDIYHTGMIYMHRADFMMDDVEMWVLTLQFKSFKTFGHALFVKQQISIIIQIAW